MKKAMAVTLPEYSTITFVAIIILLSAATFALEMATGESNGFVENFLIGCVFMASVTYLIIWYIMRE